MAIECPREAIEQARPLSAQPELLVSAALHLMSHYSTRGDDAGTCLKLASVIERHLKALAGHGELAPVLRATCHQLSEQWAGIIEQAIPARPKVTLLDRVLRFALSGRLQSWFKGMAMSLTWSPRAKLPRAVAFPVNRSTE